MISGFQWPNSRPAGLLAGYGQGCALFVRYRSFAVLLSPVIAPIVQHPLPMARLEHHVLDKARQKHLKIGTLGDLPCDKLFTGSITNNGTKACHFRERRNETVPVHRIRSG